jgi:hypothetical protein
MLIALRALIVVGLLAISCVVLFVSLMYSPDALWIIAYVLLFGAIPLGILTRRRVHRAGFCFAFSLLINAHYLSLVPYGNPVTVALLYGFALIVVVWFLLFLIAEITAGAIPRGTRLPQ